MNSIIMTAKDVKEYLHLGNGKTYELFRQKSFPSFQLDGKYLVERAKFEKWLANIQKLPGKNYIFEKSA